jgi:CheY-like chemotaxis protein
MAGAMLKKLGYEVLSTASPLEALELVQEKGDTIQLLLTDVIMPKMSGRELADKIAVLKPHIKCLFMSGYTADIIAEHGVMDEDRHFIQKPFKSENLALKLRGALE